MTIQLGNVGLNVGGPVPVNPLFGSATFTVYVDSVAGLDTNPGTQTAPFQTLDRALQYRRQFSVLFIPFAIQLVGVGPYVYNFATIQGLNTSPTAPVMILGDLSVATVHASGTFTGDMTAAAVVGTSAGLGADTQRGRHLLITSGNCAGACVPVCENTDVSVTVVNRRFRSLLGAIAANDTFQIITPGTVITSVTLNSLGGGWPTSGGGVPTIIFHRCTLSGSMTVSNSQAAFASCTVTGSLTATGRALLLGGAVSSTLGNAAGLSTNQLASCGLIAQSTVTFDQRANVTGTFAFSSANTITITNGARVELNGARIRATSVSVIRDAILFFAGTFSTADGAFRTDCPIFGYEGGSIFVGNSGNPYALLLWALTAGDCFRITRGGKLYERLTASVLPTGGTTDLAGFAIDVSGGGQAFITGGTPALTGGTAGADLATTANPAGVANATLGADGTAVDAAGSPFGDVLCRVAFV